MGNRLTNLFADLEDKVRGFGAKRLGTEVPAFQPLTREQRAALDKQVGEMLALKNLLNSAGYAVLRNEIEAQTQAAVENTIGGTTETFKRHQGIVIGLRVALKTVDRIIERGAQAQRRLHDDDAALQARAEQNRVVRT